MWKTRTTRPAEAGIESADGGTVFVDAFVDPVTGVGKIRTVGRSSVDSSWAAQFVGEAANRGRHSGSQIWTIRLMAHSHGETRC
ncbi:secretion protein HlyD [Anopheles sinensis]|uniref:Secretion protein HlyD n=1 Tax=Anopheles sinensis TaxID=74873 RepID=A0A084WBY3_ANOSI|nr:secretion protein HlyD [Anopheles sinensis]